MNSLRPILLVLLGGALATACAAQTWDATKDFGPSNPNGAWSYGAGATGLSFGLYSIYNPDCFAAYGANGVACWTANTYQETPRVGLNTTGLWINFWTMVVPPDVLFNHPGPQTDQDTIVKWTAPAAGYYDIQGFFEILDTNPTGIYGFVFRNDRILYRGELLGPPAQHPQQIGGRDDFHFRLFLLAGDVVSFAVNKDGSFYDDSTGFNATITKIPK